MNPSEIVKVRPATFLECLRGVSEGLSGISGDLRGGTVTLGKFHGNSGAFRVYQRVQDNIWRSPEFVRGTGGRLQRHFLSVVRFVPLCFA